MMRRDSVGTFASLAHVPHTARHGFDKNPLIGFSTVLPFPIGFGVTMLLPFPIGFGNVTILQKLTQDFSRFVTIFILIFVIISEYDQAILDECIIVFFYPASDGSA